MINLYVFLVILICDIIELFLGIIGYVVYGKFIVVKVLLGV